MNMYPKATYQLGNDDDIIIDCAENLAYRNKILTECASDKALAQETWRYCASGIEGMNYWINVFGWLYEPRNPTDPLIPFCTFDYQDDLNERIYSAVKGKQDLMVEKSRDMGATWCALYVFMWGWLFDKWELRVGSRKQDYVYKRGDMAALLQKMEFILKNLPVWMLPKDFSMEDHITYNIIRNPESGNSISGEPTSPNFSVGSRSTATLLDEYSKWECADLVWKNTADVTDSRIVLGTPPESKTHKFARIRLGFDKISIPTLTLHWKKHPLKTDAWYARQKLRRTESEIAKELDLSYEPVSVGRVYPKFAEEMDKGNHPYNPNLPLYTFWDYGEGGNDDTAIIWFQYNPANLHKYIIAAYKNNYRDIKFFAPFITGNITSGKYTYNDYEIKMIEAHKLWKGSTNVGDPYNGEKMTPSGDTIKSLLKEEGVYMNHEEGSKTNEAVKDRIIKATQTFNTLHINGDVDSGTEDVINSLTEARWPSVTDNRTTPVTKPVHDWTSHYRTAYEYGISFWLEDIKHRDEPVIEDPYYDKYRTFYQVGRPTTA